MGYIGRVSATKNANCIVNDKDSFKTVININRYQISYPSNGIKMIFQME